MSILQIAGLSRRAATTLTVVFHATIVFNIQCQIICLQNEAQLCAAFRDFDVKRNYS